MGPNLLIAVVGFRDQGMFTQVPCADHQTKIAIMLRQEKRLKFKYRCFSYSIQVEVRISNIL